MSDNFKQAFQGIASAVNRATQKASNRAITSTRAKYAKEVSQALGIASGKVKGRSKIIKATKDSKDATLSIGVQTLMSASLFKPRLVKGINSARGPRTGASYEVKGQGRTIASKGFIAQGKGSIAKVILQRVSGARYPLEPVRVDVFRGEVDKQTPNLMKHLRETWEKNFQSQLKYEIDNKK